MDRVPIGCPLTPGQFEVLLQVAAGKTHKEIAFESGINWNTARTQASKACHRLGVPGSIQAVIKCIDAGWITVGPDGRPEPADDIKITPEIKVWLYAFEQRLRAKSDEAKTVTREIMDRAARDAGLPWSQLRHRGERCLVDALVEVARRNGRLA